VRPVNKGGDPPYTTKTTFTFGGDNIPVIKKLLNRDNATNVPIADCLNLWLVSAKGDPAPHDGTPVELARAVKAISTQVGELYKLASVPLTTRLGPFCSFCETPLAGLLEVEHRAPKSRYPTFAIAWSNFTLACSPCNIAKGNDPTRADVEGWMGHPVAPTEQDYYDEIELHYVWPDLDSKAYDWLPHALQWWNATAGSWQDFPSVAWAINLQNEIRSVDIANRQVIARMRNPADPTGATYVDCSVRVAVLEGNAHGDAQAMIDLVELNENGDGVSTYDRRVLNRTQAWFRCLQSLNNINRVPPDLKPIFWDQMLMTAVGTGFYSVWLTIIALLNHDLGVKFVTDTNVPNYFPGTDPTDLP
jgi:hypothetical protein